MTKQRHTGLRAGRRNCWLVAVVVLASDTGLSLAQARPPHVSGATDERDALAPRVDAILGLLERVQGRASRDAFDVDSLVKSLGGDPEKLFAWVRDSTTWIPYRGVLRGPSGVMIDRLGNSLDRALLLERMLRSAGHQARIARADLPDEIAGRLLMQFRTDAPRPPIEASAQSTAEVAAEVDRILAAQGIGSGELRIAEETIALEQERGAEAAIEGVPEQIEILARHLPRPPDGVDASHEIEMLAASRDHWWVQMRRGDAWIDLDPTLSDATFNRPLVAPTRTFEPKADGASTIPDDLHHELRIEVIVEEWSPTGPRERPALECTVRPLDRFAQNIALVHFPMTWPTVAQLFEDPDPGRRIVTEALKQKEWLPALIVGSRTVQRDGVRDTGELDPNAQSRLADSLGAEAAAKGVGDILRTGRIGGADSQRRSSDDKTPENIFTAEWISYEIRAPGRSPRTIRRPVFDLVGPSARRSGQWPPSPLGRAERLRRALALLGEVDILPAVCRLTPEYVSDLFVSNVVTNRSVLSSGIAALDAGDFRRAFSTWSSMSPFPSDLHAFAVDRSVLSRMEDGVYYDEINVFSSHHLIEATASDELSALSCLDIVSNRLAIRPTPGVDPFLARVEQGILDTSLEAALVRRCGADLGASQLFQSALAEAAPWVVVRSPTDPLLDTLPIQLDARERMVEELKAGYLAVFPTRDMTRAGSVDSWYRVDARSGETLGMTSRGWGGAWTQTAFEQFLMRSYQAAIVTAACICFYDRAIKNPEPATPGWPTGIDSPPDLPQQRRQFKRGAGALVRCGLIAAISLYYPPSPKGLNLPAKLLAALMGLLWR